MFGMIWRSPSRTTVLFVVAAVLWVGLLAGFEWKAQEQRREQELRLALQRAESDFETTLYYRAWNAGHGGLYAPVTEVTQPNPYLEVENKTVELVPGEEYTLINPAYMTRQVHELMAKDGVLSARMTSLDPINPKNKPVAWERRALEALAAGESRYVEVAEGATSGAEGDAAELPGEVLRFMKPLYTEESCLQCHGPRGYRLGDLRGGLSIAVSLDKIRSASAFGWNLAHRFTYGIGLLGLLALGLFWWYFNLKKRREAFLFEELEREKERIARLTREVPGMVYEFCRDREGRMWIPRSNQWMETLFGCQLRDVENDAGPLLSRVVAEDQERLFASVEESYRRGHDWRCEFRVRDGEDRLRWLFGNSSIQKQADGSAIWYGFVTDITPQKELEHQLVEAREAAETASRAKSEFLSMMSHEIRTPMNGILPIIDMLRDEVENPEHRELLGVARQSADLLMKLINDILDYNKIVAGRIEVERRPMLPRTVVEEAVATMRSLAMKKGIAVEVEDRGEGETWVYGDAFRIQQVLLNLLNNAVKFSERGTIRVAVWMEGAGAKTLRVEICDEGRGMDEAMVKAVMEPFRQADSSTSREFGGTGLGLAICGGLMDAMGGALDLDSELGQGTRVEIRLPVELCSEIADGGRSTETLEAEARKEKAKKEEAVVWEDAVRVLMVEDEPINVAVQKRLLKRYHLEPDVAVTGEEALALLRERKYDLVLLDLQLPQMSGLEVMRQMEPMNRPYVVAMTAHALDRHREECFAAGADDFVSKPVRRAALEAALERFRERRGR